MMSSQLLEKLDSFYDRYKEEAVLLTAFVLPIKLSFTYIVLIPSILLWAVRHRFKIKDFSEMHSTAIPLLIFLIGMLVSSLFGLRPLHSITRVGVLGFYIMSIFMFRDAVKNPLLVLIMLLLGQSISSFHSVVTSTAPGLRSSFFMGSVTQSGQLALTVVVGIGLVMSLIAGSKSDKSSRGAEGTKWYSPFEASFKVGGIWGAVHFILLNLMGFASYFGMGEIGFSIVLFAAVMSLGAAISLALTLKMREDGNRVALGNLILTVVLPCLAAALLVNLKRGPWIGVFVGTIVLLFLFSKRLLIPLVLCAVCAVVFLEPVRTRIGQSSDHFYITGGRHVIWKIGSELSSRYPLGIGYENSEFLQKFDPKIPTNLDHFHNNFFNILVETGWICFGIYLWWIVSLLRTCFRDISYTPSAVLRCTLGCAFLSWQVAGIFEYNFGDSEVLLLVFCLVGMLSLLEQTHEKAAVSTSPQAQPVRGPVSP